jgi:hypothetical protein
VRRCLAALLACLASGLAWAAPGDVRVIDDFADAAPWHAGASDQVRASAVRDQAGNGLCLRYDFGNVSGYAVLRRALPLELPEHYALKLRLHGSGAPNSLQFKLVDASGDNVWWMNRPAYVPPPTPTDLVIRQRQIEFAWGPTDDKVLKHAASIELVVASGQGGHGELCFDRIELRTLPPPGPLPPLLASASSSAAAPARAVDGDSATAWRSAAGGVQHWQVDFGAPRELAGLVLRFADGARAGDFEVQFSDDGVRWHTVRRVAGNRRDGLALWLPESETRFVRLRLIHGPRERYAIGEAQVTSPLEWPNRNAALAALASLSPRGRMPRGFAGEQSYWTVVGVDGGGAHSALLSEDGAIEPHKAGPSLEPFVIDAQGKATSWADARIEHGLRDGYLPLPSVRWVGRGYSLAVEAGADGAREQAQLVARYTLTNTGNERRTLTLALVERPWQVNPPRQFLNTAGGVAEVRSVAWRDGALRVDGRPWLRPFTPPDAVGAYAFGNGDPLDQPALPPLANLGDEQGLASAVLRWRLDLAPGEARSVAVMLPLAGDASLPGQADERMAQARLDAIAAHWRERLNRVSLDLPAEAQPLADTVRSALAQILMSRDGPALQPGTRSYARSWIRDGAMMVAGLLRLGEQQAAREFVRWYAEHLFASGKVPCCVDARGADPVAENDSHGEFIFAVAELWRHTRDCALAETLWPKVDAAARYMESLRQSERTPGTKPPFLGMMPASISHEGYSAKPMHAYWDDFWALAGYRDAAMLARVLGHEARAAELERQRDEFRADLQASLAASVALHRIDFLPGAAELGDFDPSSSTLAFAPAGADNLVPRALLDATWERWWRESVARRDGQREWSDYTPYELRSVAALVRLGRPREALAMLDFFLRDQRPAGWNQWAEVVGRDAREPRFVGDMPHAWIASDAIRSVLDLLAYERDSDQALVLGAGVLPAWWRAAPVAVRGLGTSWGRLDFRLERESPEVLRLTVAGDARPPGGLWFAWTGGGPPPSSTADGRPLRWEQGSLLRLPEGRPIELRLRLGSS